MEPTFDLINRLVLTFTTPESSGSTGSIGSAVQSNIINLNSTRLSS